MPFASINPTNPRTNPWNFHKKILRIGDSEKLSFFESAILNFFFIKRKLFCFIPMKISYKLCVRMDGAQFFWLWWFTAKNHSPQKFQPAVYSKKLFSQKQIMSDHNIWICKNVIKHAFVWLLSTFTIWVVCTSQSKQNIFF